ncbi:restriction endonuclease subunit S [Janthinobacterium sp. RA13]|uniref:restriction endonuclease subunit S n=1 Tax=Janthinobacterium sp. RA13 TaxID=1502762 RepID=UPI00055ABF64|nr:restriction endonuclease subunit S [Janthinobacterium sp. RA13]
MSHYKPYPVYKESGIEWMGPVPAHWEVFRIKSLIFSSQNGFWGEEPNGDENDIPCARVADFDRSNLTVGDNLPTIRNVPAFQRESRQVCRGDLLFEKSGGGEQTLVGAVVQYTGETPVICSNFVAVIKCKSSINARWLCYANAYLYSVGINIRSIKQATGIQNIDSEDYFSERISVPSETEQGLIAGHLDRETARIDELISRKNRFIELLREKRQALITHVVTKGFDPNAPMKDTGVAWLGDVPAHWDVTRVKYVISSIGQGWSPECESRPVDDGEWGVLKVGCVNGGVFRPTENKALPLTLTPRPELALKKGDILVSRANTRELVGGCTVVEQDFPLLMICDKLYRLSVDNARANPAFLAALITVHGRREVELEATGASASMVNIAQSVILNLQVGLPPIQEQVAIIASMASGTQRYDMLISTTESSIELLKERRSALITAAVTGKIDLRETG